MGAWPEIILKANYVQGLGWFLTRFPFKFAENKNVGKTVIWGL